MSDLVKELSDLLNQKGWKLATAESCTGGMIAVAMTDMAGSSSVFDRGFVTYSNESKIELLNVSVGTLGSYGAVSPQTAEEMANGALANSNANVAVSVTGIAGPSGGTDDKPVGLVYFGFASTGKETQVLKQIFKGDRSQIRQSAATFALSHLLKIL